MQKCRYPKKKICRFYAKKRQKCNTLCITLVREGYRRLKSRSLSLEYRPWYSLTHWETINYILAYYPFLPMVTGTTGRKKLTQKALLEAPIRICPYSEQRRVVEQIESRLSVCDSIEKTVDSSLAQAEALRQSILRKAFEGRLV